MPPPTAEVASLAFFSTVAPASPTVSANDDAISLALSKPAAPAFSILLVRSVLHAPANAALPSPMFLTVLGAFAIIELLLVRLGATNAVPAFAPNIEVNTRVQRWDLNKRKKP